MLLKLKRLHGGDSTTLGVLTHNGKNICFVIEPAWLGNGEDSCIPTGLYGVRYCRLSPGGSYTDCYHVQNVPGRSGILIHSGNAGGDTLGCLLPNMSATILDKDILGKDSKRALNILHAVTGRTNFTLEIN
jgi:hypothetical protein